MTGVKDLVSEINVVTQRKKSRIVYLQLTGADIINFREFGEIITRKFDDPVTLRFALSLS